MTAFWTRGNHDQGYCDVSHEHWGRAFAGDPVDWVDLTGAVHGQKDIFLQYDYMCSEREWRLMFNSRR